ncbi:glycoside hydrolase [Cellulophaga baltica]|uniref:glycoside hydrolase family 113 n=1 Tax=Cellulophaga TaxID=104264 RepID=UPI001C07A876|nr:MULTISPECIES: glycoside hydrolase [Cellulophaga]MBU2995485.1 glycoside hydrolase [Cellulophaga baltica]MDO6766879.1 glycoside hydrolase [Cellulophaga sp. 1_MG-2023]
MKKIGFLFLCILQFSCTSQSQTKINGISFVSSREGVAQDHVEKVVNLNANHAAVMPFGFVQNINSPKVNFNTDRQWYGETKKGVSQYIDILHKNGIAVMMKPQIWIRGGEFTGTLEMHTEEDWKILEDTYRDFITMYAKVAADAKVDMFCIGTELEKFVENRPNYWLKLIVEIKEIYKGKLTYASNWDEFKKTPFWEELDYVGVDAYFPLSEAKSPTVENLKAGWRYWKDELATFSEEKSKPILFTEYGYRSMDYTAKKPWLVDRNEEKVNLEAQVNATHAIIEEFWPEKWFAGGYVWKWFINHKRSGGIEDNRFTPQNKPAENTIRELYKKYQ